MNAAQTRAKMMVNARMRLMAINVSVLKASMETIVKAVSTLMHILRVEGGHRLGSK